MPVDVTLSIEHRENKIFEDFQRTEIGRNQNRRFEKHKRNSEEGKKKIEKYFLFLFLKNIQKRLKFMKI